MLDSRVPVGFRVKSPFWAHQGAKVGQSVLFGVLGRFGQAGVLSAPWVLGLGRLATLQSPQLHALLQVLTFRLLTVDIVIASLP